MLLLAVSWSWLADLLENVSGIEVFYEEIKH